jgi:hypothetical protein
MMQFTREEGGGKMGSEEDGEEPCKGGKERNDGRDEESQREERQGFIGIPERSPF